MARRLTIVCGLAVLAVAAAAQDEAPDAAPAPDQRQPLVAYPHPLITEIFFSVPGSGGDANGDGQRSPAGDEFIELMNPHDRQNPRRRSPRG